VAKEIHNVLTIVRESACTFSDCQAKAVAYGLSPKHNMRLRRHGDPAKIDRRGPKDKDREIREMLRELSDRTYARFQRALRLCRDFELNAASVIKQCTRANGTVNYAATERLAEDMAAVRLAQQYPDAEALSAREARWRPFAYRRWAAAESPRRPFLVRPPPRLKSKERFTVKSASI
jgi:hypothetical protein